MTRSDTKPASLRGLIAVVLVSIALRLMMLPGGGQNFWPDEGRFMASYLTLDALAHGDFRLAGNCFFESSAHSGFKVLGLLPAAVLRFLPGNEANPLVDPYVPWAFFTAGSVLCLVFLWFLIRKYTASESAANWGTLLYAGGVSWFFLDRHIVPYNVGLTIIIAGWLLGARCNRLPRLALASAIVGFGYLTYNAYWNVAGLVFLVLLGDNLRARTLPPAGLLVRRGIAIAAGGASPVVAYYLVAALCGHNMIGNTVSFSQSISHGTYGTAWRTLPVMFAITEKWFMVFLLAVALLGLVCGRRHRRATLAFLALGVALAGLHVFFSDVVYKFDITIRYVKPVFLFVAAAAGIALADLLAEVGRGGRWCVFLAVVLLCGPNFAEPLSLEFPDVFQKRAAVLSRTQASGFPVQLRYCFFIHRPGEIPHYQPINAVVVVRHSHPEQYLPYQYDWFSEQDRKDFAAVDFSMVMLAQPPETGRPSGVCELLLTLPRHPPVGSSEPLLTTGSTGIGDIVSIHYLGERKVRIEWDHWGWRLNASAPFEVDPDRPDPVRVLISAPQLFSAEQGNRIRQDRNLMPLARKLLVQWDGRLVAAIDGEFYPLGNSRMVIGNNAIGGSATSADFTGAVYYSGMLDPAALVEQGRLALPRP